MLDREKKYVSRHQHYSARCPGSIFSPRRIVPQSAGYLGQNARYRSPHGAVVPAPARAATGDTLMVNGRTLAVAVTLPRLPGRRPGGAGDAWPAMRCLRARPAVGRAPALLAVSGLQPGPMTARPWRTCWPSTWPIGVRAGYARRDRERRARQVRRGAPGAAALPMRAAAAGGAQSRAALVEATVGAEKRAPCAGRCATMATGR